MTTFDEIDTGVFLQTAMKLRLRCFEVALASEGKAINRSQKSDLVFIISASNYKKHQASL
jgi:hypothetical protein